MRAIITVVCVLLAGCGTPFTAGSANVGEGGETSHIDSLSGSTGDSLPDAGEPGAGIGQIGVPNAGGSGSAGGSDTPSADAGMGGLGGSGQGGNVTVGGESGGPSAGAPAAAGTSGCVPTTCEANHWNCGTIENDGCGGHNILCTGLPNNPCIGMCGGGGTNICGPGLVGSQNNPMHTKMCETGETELWVPWDKMNYTMGSSCYRNGQNTGLYVFWCCS